MNAPALPTVRLKIERRSTHPWIFQKMVEKPAHKPRPGSLVDIIDHSGQFAGRGFYNGHSRIALRVLTDDPAVAIDAAFFHERIARAVALRRDVLKLDATSDAWRVVHAEGDGLPGLIVDRYADLIVVEFFSAGMYRYRQWVFDALAEQFPGCRFYAFAEEHVQKQESFDLRASAPPEPVRVHEHGLTFLASPGTGHKTGFFADQRDNRALLASLAGGTRVLDLCCNAGGFAIHAKVNGGAGETVAVDIDEEILAIARRNAQLNKAQVRWVQADIFPWLRDATNNGERFDVVVLDPAKLTRDRDQVIPALKKYLDMNKLAMGVLKPGGVLLTCSCTGLVSEAQFLDMLRRAAFYAGRTAQVFKVTGAGGDHPFLAQVPESRYLKAVFARIE